IKHISLNKTYLFYLVYLFSNTKDPNLLLYKELKARNIDLYDKGTVSIEDDHLIIKQLKPFLRIVYITNSILFFTLHAYKHNSHALDQEHIDDFCNNLCDYLYYGTAYPQHYLTIENMQHLDTLVDLTTEKLPPEDPLMIAISTVMREHGANGTTLELIAQQIGLAKSSLYTYFNNKTEMFTKLIQRELVLLSQLLTSITQKVQDNAQRNYLLIKTQISFYLLRPSLIPALTWMTMNETILPPEDVCQSFDIDISVFNKAIPDFRGAPMKIATYYNWMGMLTASFFMHSLRDTYIINHIDMIEKLLFIYIQRGVKQDDNQSSYDAGGNRV
ncbi:MAG: TetR/AcrR family transcriptional regulator, partial [Treponema sp.]|nr:TetR/AcrR family transcriptional regulator [Treponema sp.]